MFPGVFAFERFFKLDFSIGYSMFDGLNITLMRKWSEVRLNEGTL